MPCSPKHLVLAALLVLSAGCAQLGTPPTSARSLLHDELYPAAPTAVDPAAVFALSPAMRRYADETLAEATRTTDPRRALVDALYTRSRLALTYDASRTRNAAEAFEARAGNCLSLVIMTAAFARHLGLPVGFQSVELTELYTRSGNITFASGHVNLVMQRLPSAGVLFRGGQDELTVDFLPPAELRGQGSTAIGENMVLAMYFNNRAAEALADGRADEAYAWARAAVLQEPIFHAALNTLAVVYQRGGHVQAAEDALRRVLQADPDNAAALSNLVLLLHKSGRPAEADRVAAHLAAVQPYPPFHFLELGRKAMEAGDWAAARRHFARELKRQPHQHEVHFWAALADWRLGDSAAAAEHLKLARDFSPTMASQALYSAKLQTLQALRVQ
jgi:tetratricopeptide (TPR) repeat protein